MSGRLVPSDSAVAPGDTMGRQPKFTAEHAATATWFLRNEPIRFHGRRYFKYGLPRVLGVGEITNVGSYQGVPVFAERGVDGESPSYIYVSISPWCEFQPYDSSLDAAAVRG